MIRKILRSLLPGKVRGARRLPWPGPPGPLTHRMPLGAGALIRDEEGRILLIHQTYQQPPMWLPPGGWVDRGESPREAARREAWEELGIRVEVGRALATRSGGYGELTILFDCRRLDNAPLQLSDEIREAKYFLIDNLPPMADITRQSLLEALETLSSTDLRSPTLAKTHP